MSKENAATPTPPEPPAPTFTKEEATTLFSACDFVWRGGGVRSPKDAQVLFDLQEKLKLLGASTETPTA